MQAKSPIWRTFKRSEDGVAALEFALVSPMVIALMIGTIQIGMLELMSTNLDAAVMSTTRKIRTGAADRPVGADAFEDAICEVMIDERDKCRDRLAISVQKVTDFAAAEAVANATPTGQYDIGGPGAIILVRATYRWPLILPMYAGGFRLSEPSEALIDARAVFRNEPYA
ncbi:TadE/TadG family type IV pilus assembly protein [Phenylobacterium sp. LjRoot219]|uniref:TadE/TadG family type IV pilus assembly protein n=1 Tax=Phenylobacterium sp. LjRoot219 TaxID=3342283 RepID=UPI003ECD5E57